MRRTRTERLPAWKSWHTHTLVWLCIAMCTSGALQAQGLDPDTPRPFWLTLSLNIVLALLLVLSWWNFIRVHRRDAELWRKYEALLREKEQLSSTLEAIQAKKSGNSRGQSEGGVSEKEKDESVAILPKRPNQLNAEHISHVWVEGNYIYYKHKDEPKYILKRDRLKNVYLRLQKHHFVQTHKSYLVNMSMIKQVSWKEINLKDGSKVPLSRKHKEAFRNAYQTFHEKP